MASPLPTLTLVEVPCSRLRVDFFWLARKLLTTGFCERLEEGCFSPEKAEFTWFLIIIFLKECAYELCFLLSESTMACAFTCPEILLIF